MKKLLTIIGAFGLMTTTGNTLVGCSHQDKNNQAFFQLNTYEIHLAKKTAEKDETETIEILNFDQKIEQFKKEYQYLWDNRWKPNVDPNMPSPVEMAPFLQLEHVSGITNLSIGIEDQKLIQIAAKETRGKSTWSLNLYAIRRGNTSEFYYNVNPVYFDVFIE